MSSAKIKNSFEAIAEKMIKRLNFSNVVRHSFNDTETICSTLGLVNTFFPSRILKVYYNPDIPEEKFNSFNSLLLKNKNKIIKNELKFFNDCLSLIRNSEKDRFDVCVSTQVSAPVVFESCRVRHGVGSYTSGNGIFGMAYFKYRSSKINYVKPNLLYIKNRTSGETVHYESYKVVI